MTFVADASKHVKCFASEGHTLVDEWLPPESVTVLDACFIYQYGVILALGTISGKVFIRV